MKTIREMADLWLRDTGWRKKTKGEKLSCAYFAVSFTLMLCLGNTALMPVFALATLHSLWKLSKYAEDKD